MCNRHVMLCYCAQKRRDPAKGGAFSPAVVRQVADAGVSEGAGRGIGHAGRPFGSPGAGERESALSQQRAAPMLSSRARAPLDAYSHTCVRHPDGLIDQHWKRVCGWECVCCWSPLCGAERETKRRLRLRSQKTNKCNLFHSLSFTPRRQGSGGGGGGGGAQPLLTDHLFPFTAASTPGRPHTLQPCVHSSHHTHPH
jgi:hypothetical protein